MKPLIPITAVATALAVVLMTGCDENERVARMAEKAADRQAEQNKEMARVNREVAEGTKRLVKSNAEARKNVLAMQKDLHDQAAEVGHQRDQLESERQGIAAERLRESILGPIIANLGPLAVCALVLVFCALLVYGLRVDKGDDDAVGEVLIEELVAERPVLLPPAVSAEALQHNGPKPAAIADQTDVSPDDTKDV